MDKAKIAAQYQQLYNEAAPLAPYREQLPHWDQLREKRQQISARLGLPTTSRYWQNLHQLPARRTSYNNFTTDTVYIGKPDELSGEEQERLHRTLLDLRPWRKGPFNYFGTAIDSEWQSQQKWNRVIREVNPILEDKIVADIGCNNGYYMYKMLPLKPHLVVGFDPMEKYFFTTS